ncbi:MAG: hypothetical protein JWN89_723 [Parcubacteria group bacterium]|nr:hypothetical protein [Parcubacteria group bacterium]
MFIKVLIAVVEGDHERIRRKHPRLLFLQGFIKVEDAIVLLYMLEVPSEHVRRDEFSPVVIHASVFVRSHSVVEEDGQVAPVGMPHEARDARESEKAYNEALKHYPCIITQMRLIICTQKLDQKDPILGFFHAWVEEFAKHCELVTVVCLEEGAHDLLENVRVFSLGKEKGRSRLAYLSNFYKTIVRTRHDYDTVFVHMNPEYAVLGGPIWKMMNKKIALWYTHREVDEKLRIGEKFADIIFTASKEGFGLQSRKVRVVGHGIDINKFPPITSDLSKDREILYLGRITKIKNIETILQAFPLLPDVSRLRLAGPTVTREDAVYKAALEKMIEALGIGQKVVWDGSGEDDRTFTPSTISVNASPDGGMDKAVLGSIAAGAPAFASNAAFRNVFGEYADTFLYPYGDERSLAEKIKAFLALPDDVRAHTLETLKGKVRREYSTEAVVGKIMAELS